MASIMPTESTVYRRQLFNCLQPMDWLISSMQLNGARPTCVIRNTISWLLKPTLNFRKLSYVLFALIDYTSKGLLRPIIDCTKIAELFPIYRTLGLPDNTCTVVMYRSCNNALCFQRLLFILYIRQLSLCAPLFLYPASHKLWCFQVPSLHSWTPIY